jgi:RNA polymerase sigma-70 factor (ECF subfamily)
MEAALLRLPEGMRRILVLHDVEGFTHEEIGEVLEITPGTSKSQLFKARAKLRGILSEAVIAGEIGPSDARAPVRQGIERGGMRGWST